MTEEVPVVSRDGDRLVIAWRGDVDMANIASLEQRTLAAVQNSDTAATIDLTEVTYIDSAGIRTLLVIRRMLEDRQQRLALMLPADSVLNRALEIGGITSVIPVHRSADAAKQE